MIFTFDLPLDSEPAFAELLAHQRLDVLERVEHGPAGGNPRYRVIADTHAGAQALIDFYFGKAA